MIEPTPSLLFSKITMTLGRKKILSEISGEIYPGQLTAIMGLNGAGKTTLLKILSGALPPNHGEIFYFGKEIKKLPVSQRALQVAYVPQDFPTDFPFSIDELVEMGNYARIKSHRRHRDEKDFKKKAMDIVRLTIDPTRQVQSLSGGERQKVLLARALYQDTPIILMDEPLNHLDIKSRQECLDIFKQLAIVHGKTVVAILHDLHAVKSHFDRVLILSEGSLPYQGVVAETFDAKCMQSFFQVEQASP